MSIERTEAIVLQSRDWSETSKIVTFYTRRFGRIKGLAKGARRKEGYGISLEPFSHVDLIFYEREGRDLQTVSDCTLKESFQELREDLLKMAYASYLVELLIEMTKGRERNEELFHLLLETLRLLRHGVDKEMTTRFFEVHLLRLSGYLPWLSSCVSCHKEVGNELCFSALLGGVLCTRCRGKDEDAIGLSQGTASLLQYLARIDPDRVDRVRGSMQLRQEAKRMLESYLTHLLEKRLKSLDFLSQIEYEDNPHILYAP